MVRGAPDDVGRLRALHELTTAFAARTALDDLVPYVIARCREVLDAEGASVLLLDRERGELYFPYVAAAPRVAARLARIRFPADRGLAGEVVRTGRALRVDDVRRDARFYPGVDRATGATTRSVLAAPLVTADGVIGVVQVVNHRGGGAFDDEDVRFLAALAGAIAVAVGNAQLYERLRAAGDRLRAQLGTRAPDAAPGAGGAPVALRAARTAFERRHIESVLREHGGDVVRAARALRLSPAALRRRLRAAPPARTRRRRSP
jgi:GAF domain-containing protein